MKHLLTAVLALTLLNGASSMAQPNNSGRTDQNRTDQGRDDHNGNDRNRNDRGRDDHERNERNDRNRYDQSRNDHGRNDQGRREESRDHDRRNDPGARSGSPRWSRGDRLPDQYRQRQYVVNDWQQRNLRRPPRGYHWVHNDNRNYFLVVIGSGVVAETVYRDDIDQRWRRGYARTYSYDDDIYYRECRTSSDPAGVIVGALIGGLLGNTVGSGGGRTGATIAGVIVGGVAGAALTSNLDCEDRSYAYRTYYDGFNSGRENSRYQWRNPRNDHRGEFRVGKYYDDMYGFHCAEYTQLAYIQGRPQEVRGRACRQPDGAWAIVG
ncbi:MAG: RcnB family protein [Alphaproteobacteria bacterium]